MTDLLDDLRKLQAENAELQAKIESLQDPCDECGHPKTMDDEGGEECVVCDLRATVERLEDRHQEIEQAIEGVMLWTVKDDPISKLRHLLADIRATESHFKARAILARDVKEAE